MKLIAPHYYRRFTCIADRCKKNCCIGWEIDVDEETLAFYDSVKGAFGERLQKGIVREDGSAFMRLDSNERCPFLNERGLCDIIITLGEGALCEICTEHPRFRHFYRDRTELGLGMACEAASALILGEEEPMRLVTLEDDGLSEEDEEERAFFLLREELLRIATDRQMPLDLRMCRLLEFVHAALPARTPSEWARFYRSLERLDPAWESILVYMEQLPDESLVPDKNALPCTEAAFEQLLVYYLYRHLERENVAAGVAFAVHVTCLLRSLAAFLAQRTDLVELCRLYSAEIEYSEENTEALLFSF